MVLGKASIAILLIGFCSGSGGFSGSINKMTAHCKTADRFSLEGSYCMGFSIVGSSQNDPCYVTPSPNTCTHTFAIFDRRNLTDEFDVMLFGKVKPETGWFGIGFDVNGTQEPDEEKEFPGAPGFGVACLNTTAVILIELPKTADSGTMTSGDVNVLTTKSPYHQIIHGNRDIAVLDEDDPEWDFCPFRLKMPLTHRKSGKPIEYIYKFYTNPTEGAATNSTDGEGKWKITIPGATIVTDSGRPRDDLWRIGLEIKTTTSTTKGSTDDKGTGGGDDKTDEGGNDKNGEEGDKASEGDTNSNSKTDKARKGKPQYNKGKKPKKDGDGDGVGHLVLLPGLLIIGAASAIGLSLLH